MTVIVPSEEDSVSTCRIMYLVGQLGVGGLERQLFYLLQTMNRQRYRPVLVVWNYSDKDPYAQKIKSLDVPVICIGNNLSRMGKLLAFRRMLSQFQPEIVHSYSFYTNWAAWWATIGSRAISIGSIRNSFLFDRQSTGMIMGRACARWPRVQICNSGAAKNTVESCATPFKPNQVYLVRNGLDLNYFSPQPPPHNLTLLAVGSLYAKKRWDRMVNIVSKLSAKGIRLEVRHVGNGPLRGELEELARRLGVDSRIRFLGVRNDIPKLLADSYFLIHTAEDEGCPNVVMEAMACGRAVVAMDAGDIPFLIDDEKTGFVVRRGDEATFADRVAQLIFDNDLCCHMGLAARAKAEREFGLARLVSETLISYKAAGWRDTERRESTLTPA
jgi:glycosyltransferase involved in cell wall biosynthesis